MIYFLQKKDFKDMLRKIILTITILLVGGCSGKNIVQEKNQESAFIILKTPKIKYADMGFIYRGDSFTKVEIYQMGQPIMRLTINGMNICLSTLKCMEKRDFNREMLIASYPDTLLENIFRGKPIFKGKNLKKESNGFTQNIEKKGKYSIKYKVNGDNKIFHDIRNHIKIEVRVI